MRVFQTLSIFVLSIGLVGCAWIGSTTSEPAPAPAIETPTPPAPNKMPVAKTGEMCGGIAAFECKEASDYCKMEDGACWAVADSAGVCTTIQPMCTREYRPVCGCDGQEYPNACTAQAAGVSIASRTKCKN